MTSSNDPQWCIHCSSLAHSQVAPYLQPQIRLRRSSVWIDSRCNGHSTRFVRHKNQNSLLVLAYAKIVSLPVQFGLYSAYIGAIMYTLMGTSKDISIGPTAVVSLLIGETLSDMSNEEEVQFVSQVED